MQTLKVTVKLKTQKQKCWLHIFSQHLWGDSRILQEVLVNEEYGFKVPKLKREGFLNVEVFVARSLCNGTDIVDEAKSSSCQPFYTRAGFAHLDTFRTTERMVDITGMEIGSIDYVCVEWKGSRQPAIDRQQAVVQQFRQLRDDAERQAREFKGGSNITSQLPDIKYLRIQQPLLRELPMWSYVLLNLIRSKPNSEYFEQAVANAKFQLGIRGPIDPENKAQVAEMLNEMQTLPTRAQLYTIDTSVVGNRPIDDWVNPLNTPTPNLLGLDCEDAAMRIVQDAIWWRQASATTPECLQLRAAENEYITFFVAMTLKVFGVFHNQSVSAQWVYHAAAVKLDRQWVLSKLLLNKKKQGNSTPRPAVLLEGTAYTTGCWEYKHQQGLDKTSFNSQAAFSKGDTICKVTPAMIHEKGLYGHMISLFSPQLASEYGIVQVDLSENDKRAALTRSIMNYDDKVQWHPIKLDRKEVSTAVKELQLISYPPLRAPQVQQIRRYLPKEQVSEIAFAVRKVDWNEDTREELEKHFGKRLNSVEIQIAQDLQLVHCYSP